MSLDKAANLETNEPVDMSYATINASVTPYALTKHLSIPIYLNKAERSCKALLDSGAMGNFIHEQLVEELGLVRTPWNPLPLLDVKGIKIGELAFQANVLMRVGAHEEKITLDIAPIGNHKLILGLPWLQAHNPTIDWSTGHTQFNSQHCNDHCLPQPHDTFAQQEPILFNQSTEINQNDINSESSDATTMEPDLVNIYAIDLMLTATEEELRGIIPPEYHDFLDVFDPEGPT